MEGLETDHRRITAEGWSYRMNSRGWVIYRNPNNGRWYTRQEALAIIDSQPRQASA